MPTQLLPGSTPVQIITSFTFLVVCLAMGAGAFFFFHEKDKVHPRYGLPLLLATLITGIASVMYYMMRDKYLPGQVFPTEIRYIDWVLTTPLMLIEFAVLLDFKDRGGVIWRLVLWDLIMIIFGFIGETNGFQTGGFQTRWVAFVIGCGGWLGILVYLYTGIRRQANLADAETRRSIIMLTKFVTIGWCVYPIGYIVRAIQPDLSDLCQICYNLGDVLNKVGLGIIVYAGGMAALKASSSETATKPQVNESAPTSAVS